MPVLRLPASLYGRTALTVGAAFAAMLLLVAAAIFLAVLRPMAQRSADDLAALIVLSAQTWVELPPATRPDFHDELVAGHQLWLAVPDVPAPPGAGMPPRAPYARLLAQALQRRAGADAHVWLADQWVWTEIATGGTRLRVGFAQERIGTQPTTALAATLLAAALAAWLVTLALVRRLTRPLERLTHAAERVGAGELPAPLPEDGTRELALLARSFNRMARQVRELVDNRTTLLAGVSHDLRSPLARMRLALEMLADDPRPALMERMRDDIDGMNRLIGEFLALARGLQDAPRQPFDAVAQVSQAVEAARGGGVSISWRPGAACPVEGRPLALRRILDNLVGNAQRYGGGEVAVECAAVAGGDTVVRVLDRGPGIAADQFEAVFRPFYRVEGSRSQDTGGTGLGLAIARQLAQANGWRVDLHPRSGGGLEARVTLPAVPHGDGGQQRPAVPAGQPR